MQGTHTICTTQTLDKCGTVCAFWVKIRHRVVLARICKGCLLLLHGCTLQKLYGVQSTYVWQI